MARSRLADRIDTLAQVVSGRAPTAARDTAYQLQIYAIAWISLLVSGLIYVPVYLVWLDEPVGALAIGLASVVGLGTAVLYVLSRSTRLALQAMSAAIFTVVSFLTWHQGGLSSPVAPWLLIVPFSLSCAGLQGPANVWFVVIVAEMAILGALEYTGHPLPFNRGNDPQVLYIVSEPGLCALVFVFLLLVNRARQGAFSDLSTRNDELVAARDLAMAAVREKSRFLANMSHEIRTPLNGVLGTADVLSSTSLTPEQRRFVGMLKQSGDSLLALINDVLDFSKIEAGKVVLENVALDPRALAEDVAELFAPRASEKGLICTCRVAPRVPSGIRSDPLRLRQVLSNLLSNATKFTASGDVAIEVDAVAVAGEPDQVDVTFRVIDTGIGIDAKARERLFQAFSQGDDSTTRVFGGTGLGLAISGELVRLMGSRIVVDSEPTKGSCFHFTVRSPVVRGPGPVTVRRPAAPASVTVGVMEPHPRSRVVLIELLDAIGARAVVFESMSSLLAAMQSRTCPRTCFVGGRALRDPHTADGLRELSRTLGTALPRLFVTTPFGESAPELPGLEIGGTLAQPLRRAALEEMLFGTDVAVARACSAASTRSLQGRRVLLVEDNRVNQQIALAMLRQLGCEVDMATDGAMGLRTWREKRYDLVLMDCQMPVMDGYSATREIRAIESARGMDRTPVVALTANALAGDREQCLESGMDDHLGKPFTLDLLRECVTRWVCEPGDTLPPAAGVGG